MMIRFNSLILLIIFLSCSASSTKTPETMNVAIDAESNSVEAPPLFYNNEIKVGAERMEEYLPQLLDKKVGIVGNQSSRVKDSHLVDTLLGRGVEIVRVFSPEHGFRGAASAGELVKDETDEKTGLPIVSLYGNNKKPGVNQMKGIEVMLFDLQDVGLRFYTYISTLHYVMEACAENDVQLIVLDRPNPNGHYVDGPVLEEKFKSFIGMHPVPVVHGMTIAEYAQMINEEGWLENGVKCDLKWVSCEGYDHTRFYELPIAPSPNLPNMTAVYLYPELCFFEGTVVSIGRGTNYPFQVIGHPDFKSDSTAFNFTPQPNQGAKHPKLENEKCYGVDLHQLELRDLQKINQLDLSRLFTFYENLNRGSDFFLPNHFIDLLYGSDQLRVDMIRGDRFDEIRESWDPGLKAFKEKRKKYLLYPDFE